MSSNRIIKRTHLVAIIFVLLALFEFYNSKYKLINTSYELTSTKITKKIRILQISDLHNSEFGKNNEQLIGIVTKQNPDIIIITGDILNEDEVNLDIAINLISHMVQIAPTYLSYGNHEISYEERYGKNLVDIFEAAGAFVLEYSYMDIYVDSQMIRLGGLYGYCLPEKYLDPHDNDTKAECEYINCFQSTDLYTILLCHMPVCWIQNSGLDEWNVDCVFSGHAHGGQVRIPFIGGLWAPDQGWFPGRESGMYYSSDQSKVMILSRGLGSTESIPRFNNIPEVVTVDILPK